MCNSGVSGAAIVLVLFSLLIMELVQVQELVLTTLL